MKITSKHLSVLYDLTADQFNAVEMHSFLNVINVIHLQLDILRSKTGHRDILQKIIEETEKLTLKIKNRERNSFFPENIKGYQDAIFAALKRLETSADDRETIKEIRDAREIFKEVFRVMDIRSAELLQQTAKPGQWLTYSIDEFKDDFNLFFHAVEKNAKGRYRIVQNIAKQDSNDYLVQFEVDSELDGKITMPLIFKDVIRDLIANARKYTDPGGQIHVGVYQKKNILRFIVEDNGIGIPEKETDRVFEYGYRAKNARSRQTMGDGFGLTKALYITVQLNGDMWIESEEGGGTKIIIEIPVPEKFVTAG